MQYISKSQHVSKPIVSLIHIYMYNTNPNQETIGFETCWFLL